MKKFLALLLAAMMLLSCTTAMAATQNDTIVNELHEDWDSENSDKAWKQNDTDDNATFGAFDSVRYGDDGLNDTDDDNFDESGELGTELWMQVTADGQIDVTVPLVLVFQTNIDGGYATTADKYQILNNNNAEIVVTKMEFNKTDLGNGNLMTMKPSSTQSLLENEYWATLTAKDVEQNKVLYNGAELTDKTPINVKDADDMKVFRTKADYDDYQKDPQNTAKYISTNNARNIYDMNSYAYIKPAKTAGLFKLNKTENGGFTPTPTVIDVAMKTGRLTFVTQDEEDEETTKMDTAKGIHLLTTTYTVAIDTSNLYEYTIRGADGSPLTSAGEDVQPVVQVSTNSSLTVPNVNPKDQNDHNEIDDRSLNNADGKTTGNDATAGEEEDTGNPPAGEGESTDP